MGRKINNDKLPLTPNTLGGAEDTQLDMVATETDLQVALETTGDGDTFLTHFRGWWLLVTKPFCLPCATDFRSCHYR